MGGFFGVVSKVNAVPDLFFGTDYHSHLGTVRGGMAVLDDRRFFHRAIHDIGNTQFRSKFDGDFQYFNTLNSCAGIGVISDYDDQPILIASHLGVYAIVTVGVLTNVDALVEELYRKNSTHLAELGRGMINPTEVVAALIDSQPTFAEGIRYAQSRVEGSCSLIVLNDKGEMYVARDTYGRTPIALAEKDDARAVAMESCAFPNIGYTPVRDIAPGEIVKVLPDVVETLYRPEKPQTATCAFMWVYFGYPASTFDGRNVEAMRYRSGRLLARRNPVDADCVAGVPDSGVGHALGYAAESGIPYERPFVKYTPTWPRSFMPSDQTLRQHIARMKLIPIPELIKGKRLIFCDDSIVRGTQLRDQVRRLNAAGAKEIHMRIACPPLLHNCRFINFSRSRSVMDLVTRRVIQELEGDGADIRKYQDPDGAPYKKMVEVIRARLGLTTLAYQRIDDLKQAIALDGDPVCTYCWDGRDITLQEPKATL